jgi:hypothetical protein
LCLSDPEDTETVNTLILSEIKRVCDDLPDDKNFIGTVQLIKELNEDKSLPWSDWGRGDTKGLTEMKLGVILKAFGIKSERIWDGVKKVSGYNIKSLKPIFECYVRLVPPENPVKPANET